MIGLGSNLGDRLAHMRLAVRRIADLGRLRAVSSLYETAPVGGPAQGPYLNAVVAVGTSVEPRAVLDHLLAVEALAGRVRRARWGPRTLDLDLLLHGERMVDEPGLRVPHPGLTSRRFVLAPLLEVRPAAALPDGTPLAPFLQQVAGQEAAVVARPGWAG